MRRGCRGWVEAERGECVGGGWRLKEERVDA